MQMKGRVRGHWNFGKKLGLSSVMFLCFSLFLAGFFASTFIHQDVPDPNPLPRSLESVDCKEEEFDLSTPGDSGDEIITSIHFQVLSWKPRILYFPKFATAEQCESIIAIAKPGLEPSRLALREGETRDSTKDVRTSSGMFISAFEDNTGVIGAIEEKIARATLIPRNHGEDFNILRYEIGQKYNSHYDAFSPLEYGPQKSQRIASFLLYLSDVEEGGETMFPYENERFDLKYDFVKCVGLKVKPRRGDGILFYSVFLNGTIDQTSLHGSCPVVKGEKWVATKWLRDQVQ